jgi:hypothetical protein
MKSGWKNLFIGGSLVVTFALLAPVIPGLDLQPCACRGGSTKANMHFVQLAVEDFAVQHDGRYPWTSDDVASCLPANGARLKNPYTQAPLVVAVRRGDMADSEPGVPGLVVLCRPGATSYVIRGCGKSGNWLSLRLTSEP